MEFFKTLTLDEINQTLRYEGDLKNRVETVPLLKAYSRVTADDYHATYDLPMFNRSTVDGYAVKSAETTGASTSLPSFFTYAGEVKMGEMATKTLGPGQAIYVPTGGMIPDGADAMVMIEYVEKMDEENLLIYKPSPVGAHVSYRGDDLHNGEVIVPRGRKLSAYDIGLLSGAGYSSVDVYRELKVAIISTGDEIIDVDEPIEMGKIRDVNGYALSARLEELGCEVSMKVLVKDDFWALKSAVEEAIQKSDMILLSGGSSVGTRDFTSDVITSFENSSLIAHGVAVKPGKPTIVGKINEQYVFGLPGHPASALIIFNSIVMPLILSYEGRKHTPFSVRATLTENVHASPGKDTFQMVKLISGGEGYKCEPLYAKSGMMTLLANASGYIHLANTAEGLEAGTETSVILLQEVRI